VSELQKSVPPNQRWKLIAIIVKGSKPLSVACNLPQKTHPQSMQGRGSHAEVRCLRRVQKNSFRKATMYVFRIDSLGSFRLAKPCPHCMKAIQESHRIKRVVYSTNNGLMAKMDL
jgi:tRNA(Arg) A34 adenosine deaminase TadA